MNTFQLNNLMNNPKEQLEPTELESWELTDFDDVLQSSEISTLESETIWEK